MNKRNTVVLALIPLGLVYLFIGNISFDISQTSSILDSFVPQLFADVENTKIRSTFQARWITSHYDNSSPVVLFWTQWFGTEFQIKHGLVECHENHNRCYFTSDKSYYPRSDAVIFHGCDEDIRNPSFFPIYWKRRYKPIWIYHSQENPIVTAELGYPIDSRLDGIFNWTMTYTKNSDVFAGYGRIVPGVFKGGFRPKKNYASGKTKLIAWIASNCKEKRSNFVKELQNYISIDTYGKCGQKECKGYEECLTSLLPEYKFYLSFENAVCTDYVTEKFYRNALEIGVIPIIINGANRSDTSIMPPNSYIDASAFKTIKDLAKFIKKVSMNDALYNSYFAWRSKYEIEALSRNHTAMFCLLCNKLHSRTKWPSKTYKITDYWAAEKQCRSYPEPNV